MLKKIAALLVVVIIISVNFNIMANEPGKELMHSQTQYVNSIVKKHIGTILQFGILDNINDTIKIGDPVMVKDSENGTVLTSYRIYSKKLLAVLNVISRDGKFYSTLNLNDGLIEKSNIKRNNIIDDMNIDFKTLRVSDSNFLNIDGIRQGQTSWCWAATIATNVNYINGERLSAYDVVRAVKDNVDYNEGGTDTNAIDAYIYYGLDPEFHGRNIDIREVMYSIDNNRPLDVRLRRWKRNEGYGRHAVSLYGYREYSDGSVIYAIWDPARGYATVDVDNRGDFVYSTNNGTYLWDNTIVLR